MKIALFDLDHTISNSTWRDVLLPPSGSWDEYHEALGGDKPHLSICSMIRDLQAARYSCLGITMRPEKWRAPTMQWLLKYDVPLSWILMREPSDYAPAAESKLALIEKHFSESQRRDIQFYVDDREDCCAAVTEKYGITSFTVRHRVKS
jgi:hypothetical protein